MPSLGPLQAWQSCYPWWRACLTPPGCYLEPFGPLLRTVQDSKNVDGLPPDTVGDDVRLRGDHQLTGPGHSPAPAHLGERDQPSDAVRDGVVHAFGGRGVVFQHSINDGEELSPCPLRPLDGHYWPSRALRILARASVLTSSWGTRSPRSASSTPCWICAICQAWTSRYWSIASLTTQLRERSSTWAKASSWRCFSGGIRTVKTPSAMLWSSVVHMSSCVIYHGWRGHARSMPLRVGS